MFDHLQFRPGEQLLHFPTEGLIAGDHRDRDAQRAGQNGIKSYLTDLYLVQAHPLDHAAQEGMVQDPSACPSLSMVADQQCCRGPGFDVLHHQERFNIPADQLGLFVELFRQQIPQYITSIPGIGPVTGAAILSEIGNIQRFETPEKLVAYAGLDATVYQTGQFEATEKRTSAKRLSLLTPCPLAGSQYGCPLQSGLDGLLLRQTAGRQAPQRRRQRGLPETGRSGVYRPQGATPLHYSMTF